MVVLYIQNVIKLIKKPLKLSSNYLQKYKDFKPEIYYDELEKIKERIDSLQHITSKEKTGLLAEVKNYIDKKPDILTKNEELNKNYNALVSAYDKVMGNGDKLAEQASPLKQVSLMNAFIDKENNKSTTFTSVPLMFLEDETTLKLTFTPKDSASTLPIHYTELKFPTQNNSYWGVSTGFYATVMPQDYYSLLGAEVPISDTTFQTQYQLVDEDISGFELGFSAMIRRGWFSGKGVERFSSSRSWHVGFGPGNRLGEKIQPSLLLGAGAGFGREHKVLIDVGAIIGPVDRKSNVFDLNERYPNIESGDIVVSHIRMSGYMSVSYLFGF